jgi:DNA polymerase-3 subunit delta
VSTVAVVGSDATMVADALRQAIAEALDGLDPAVALLDVTARDATSDDGALARVLEALYTPAFVVERRVVALRDAQSLSADEVRALEAWMGSPTPGTTLLVAFVGSKSNRLVKAAARVVEVNVGTRARDRAAFVEAKLAEYGVRADAAAAEYVAGRVGEDVARVDAIARTLAAIFPGSPVGVEEVAPYVGDAGGVPPWDLTDAIDRGDVTAALVTARRMLDSRERAGLQVVSILQRHYLAMARLEGSGVRDREAAGERLGMNAFPAEKAMRGAERLGRERVAQAVRYLAQADADLKGAVSFGGRDLDHDADVTDLTVVEVLVARLASLSRGARRR